MAAAGNGQGCATRFNVPPPLPCLHRLRGRGRKCVSAVCKKKPRRSGVVNQFGIRAEPVIGISPQILWHGFLLTIISSCPTSK